MEQEQSGVITKDKALYKVAELATEKYDVQVDELVFLSEETNILYKLKDHLGYTYVMKIFQEESSSLEDNLTEIFFMDIVNKANYVSAPRMISGKDGEKLQVIKSTYTSTPKRVALYSWLEGDDLEGNECEKRFIQLGELTARLHKTTYGIQIPSKITPKTWDKVFYYQGEEAIYKHEKYQKFLSNEFHQIMDGIIPFLNDQLSTYYKNNNEDLQLIHGDLNPSNIKVNGEQMHLIDFEDSMFGLPIHDISIMLYYYKYEETQNFDEVKRFYFQGYRKVRDLPNITDYELELFMTARRVNFLNYILEVSNDPVDFIETSLPRVKEFVEKYNINLLK
ncbi:phosphotransferase [Bacillus sp. SM2101]|uniref:phosphotransferase enzyme family protein n=1 Tax=Bacillus sp. SM2101 TaxID=2805366 RepID=UPI001BDE3469|nr:phosphotransferase [Bacillus sp. SM2101]